MCDVDELSSLSSSSAPQPIMKAPAGAISPSPQRPCFGFGRPSANSAELLWAPSWIHMKYRLRLTDAFQSTWHVCFNFPGDLKETAFHFSPQGKRALLSCLRPVSRYQISFGRQLGSRIVQNEGCRSSYSWSFRWGLHSSGIGIIVDLVSALQGLPRVLARHGCAEVVVPSALASRCQVSAAARSTSLKLPSCLIWHKENNTARSWEHRDYHPSFFRILNLIVAEIYPWWIRYCSVLIGVRSIV